MKVYPTTGMVCGKETYEEREHLLKAMLRMEFEKWHCDYRIDLKDIQTELNEYIKCRGK